MRDWIREQEGCAKVHVCVVCVWARTDVNVTWGSMRLFWNSSVRNGVYSWARFLRFSLRCVCLRACACACVCMLEPVCVSRHARGCSHISLSPGDDAKNMWLLKPSGVWAASVCSPLLSLWPSLPSVTPVSSIPPSITPSSKHSTLASAHTHTPTTPSCVPTTLPLRMTSAQPERDKERRMKRREKGRKWRRKM